MLKRGTTASVLSIAAGLWLGCFTSAAFATDLPPRSASDIVALLRKSPTQSESLAAARRLLETPEPTETEGLAAAEAWRTRAQAAEQLGLTNRYLLAYRKAWEATGRSTDPSNVLLRVEYTAAETHAGNMMTAIKVMEEQASRSPIAGQRLAATAFLAENYARFGELETAARHLKIAESDYSSLQRSPNWGIWGYTWEASMERAHGALAVAQGKFDVAERHFRKSAELRERDLERNRFRLDSGRETFSQPIAVGHMLVARKGFADALLMQGRLVEAEVVYREIVTRGVSEFGTTSPLMQLHLEGMTNVLLEQGRAGDARDLAAATLEMLEKQGTAPESRMLTSTRRRLAAAYVALGQWAQARQQYDAIAAVFERDEELRRRLGQGDKDWALALIRTGQSADAVRMMEKMVTFEALRFSDTDLPLAEARAFLAMALAGAGHPDRALDEFQKSVPMLLRSQQDAADEGLTAATRRLVVVLEAYLDLLAKLHREGKKPAGLDPVDEAFRIADVARGSSVQRALIASSARATIRDPRLAQLARDEQDLSHRISTLTDTLSRLASAPQDQRLEKIIGDIRKDIPELKQQRQRLREAIAKDFPGYANLIAPKPLTPNEIRPLLAADEAMLAIYSADQNTYVWSFSKTGRVEFATLPLTPSALKERVAHLRAQLDPGAGIGFDLDFSLTIAHELFQRVVKPVQSGFSSARQLLVVSHGPLSQLPFAVMTTQPFTAVRSPLPFESLAKAPWLIRDFAITQLPAASTLAALRGTKSVHETPRSPFLGIGNPTFGAQQHAAYPQQTRSVALRRGVSTRSSGSATLSDLAPLPDTAAEVEDIASAVGADPSKDVLLGANANETAVKKMDLSGVRIVTFATHGLTPGDLNGLTQPALALSNPAVTGEADADGLLTMEEILGLRMNADWVVLSACNTAFGDGQSGEALSGLGRAFFFAGSRALLATNWPVETVSARLLTTDIFRRQAEQATLGRAQALRAAMLALMETSARDPKSGKPVFSYAHPIFWAPYSLIGDGGN